MAYQSDMPGINQGIGLMLTAFATNIPGVLATKYGITQAQITRVMQAQMVRLWC